MGKDPLWYVRKANIELIKQELKNYHATKRRIIDLIREVIQEAEDIAYPKASGGNVGYVTLHYTENGEEKTKIIYDFLRHGGGATDPTFEQVQRVMKYKAGRLTSLGLAEMVRRVDAIDQVIEELKKQIQSPDPNIKKDATDKLTILNEKYLGKEKILNDNGIAQKLIVSIASFYRLQNDIFKMIANILGWPI
jgi:hypothetical protein